MNEKTKVLLLDDTEDAIVLQKVILESSGYEVVSAINGIEGLEKLKNFHPDIIISDVLMPKMDGFEFCRKVKADANFKDIPFVFYSAQYTDKNDQKLADELGAQRFIVKPIDIGKFLTIINEVLNKGTELSTDKVSEKKPDIQAFDEKHYMAQAKMLDKKLKELEEQHQKLRQSEENYRRVLEGLSSDYFIYRHNVDRLFSYVSPTITEMLGYTTEEFHTHYSSYLTDDPVNDHAHDYTDKALAGEQQPSYELELRAKDGSAVRLQISEKPLRDKQGTVIGIEGIAHNITAEKALENLKRESTEQVHTALVDALRAISITVEKRDPYTAGHQMRVAELAVLIGKKLDLTEQQLEGLQLGSMVHDIGKITIPAEILTTPRKLNDIEYGLIKTHPQQGYEILKDIAFPWPISKMILQHHERLDGSGYPQGLKGDDIIIEAQIICVADVIEAISSHRPYRASLGLEAAKEEVKAHSGTLYTVSIVDAALEVIEENPTLLEQ